MACAGLPWLRQLRADALWGHWVRAEPSFVGTLFRAEPRFVGTLGSSRPLLKT